MAVHHFFGSVVGKKLVMAVTGAALILFIIVHMLGNLEVFLGPDKLNGYAQGLRDLGALLWTLRIGLIVMAILHIWAATSLTLQNRAARPFGYREDKVIGASYASRTMAYSGVIVLAFLVYHLLHFTFGMTNPNEFEVHDLHGRHDVFRMVVVGFQNPIVSISYIVAVALLAMHLSHGFASAFRSIGWVNKSWRPVQENASVALATLIFVGQAIVPLAILTGFVTLGGH